MLAAVLCSAAAVGASLIREKRYTASASLLFRDPALDQKLLGTPLLAPSRDPAREAATNVRLVGLGVVADGTAKRLGGDLTGREVTDAVAVSPEGESDVTAITATTDSPDMSTRMANTFAEEYIRFRREADRAKIRDAQQLVEAQLQALPKKEAAGARGRSLRTRAEELEVLAALQTGNAELVQRAERPTSPSAPKPVRNGLIGGFVGLLLGLGIAFLAQRLDRRIRDPNEVSALFDRPILGTVAESRTLPSAGKDLGNLEPGDAEAFRMLRANLLFFNVRRDIKTVLITSAAPGEGKTTVALNLAAAAAGAGSKVLLLEADLRRPTLAQMLAIEPAGGLSQVLAGIKALPEVVRPVSVASHTNGRSHDRVMDVVTAGPLPPNPLDLLDSAAMKHLLKEAEEQYELVVVDSPPMAAVADALPLVKLVSGVIVVTRLGKTTYDASSHLARQLENLEAPTLGVVVNSEPPQHDGYAAYYAYEAS